MTKIIGRLKEIGIGKESSRGGGITPTYWLPKINFTIENKTIKARSRQNYGVIGMDGNQAIPAKVWAEGSLEMDMHDKSFGLLLLALLGAETPSGPTDSAYTHTYTLANTNTHQSLAITAKESSLSTQMFKLAMIKSMTLELTPEAPVKVTVDFQAKKGVDAVVPSATYVVENKFLGRDLAFKIAALTGNLAAATAIPVKKLTLKIEKNTMLDHSLGTVQPQDILNQGFRITGDVELDYQDRTYVDYMTNGTYKAVRIALTNSRTLIGATSVPVFTLDLSRVEFDAWESAAANDAIMTQKFTFTALYDITNGNIINSCTLVNAVATY
jgi:hypothetical protein